FDDVLSSSACNNPPTLLLSASVSENATLLAALKLALSKRQKFAPGSPVVAVFKRQRLPASTPAAPVAPCGPVAPAGPGPPAAPVGPALPCGPRGDVHVIVQSARVATVGPMSVTFTTSVLPL